jgi:catalase
VVKIKPTFSRERVSWIVGKNYSLIPLHRPRCHNQKPKRHTHAPQRIRKKKTCKYCGKTGHMEKDCYKKRDDLKEKIKRLEGDMFVVCRPIDNFTFQFKTSHTLLSHFAQNELVVDSRCTHHMVKDASLFTSMNDTEERKICVDDDFSLDIVGQGDVTYRHGKFFYVYHVTNPSPNLLFFSQLT